AGRAWVFLRRYCRVLDLRGPAAAQFLECYYGLTEKVLRADSPADQAQAEDRERVRRWVDEHQPLAERLECGPAFVRSLGAFLLTLRENLLTPGDRALRGRRLLLFRRQSARVPLSPAERAAICNEEVEASLARLAAAVRGGAAASRQRAADFEAAL